MGRTTPVTVTPQLPDPTRSITALRRIIAERSEANRKKPKPGGVDELNALKTALEICIIAERITYYEQSDPPQDELDNSTRGMAR
jgi:hypothetical protein